MLKLPVTLTIVETQCHQLAQLALEDCLKQAEFDQVVICSDFPGSGLELPGAKHVFIGDAQTIDEIAHFIWYLLPAYIETSHMFLIHWDSWIIDPDMWRPQFLEYDWVGAPWWHKDGFNVGCGAFCLRSARLMNYLATHRNEFPDFKGDDDVICRRYRPALERAGFKWPSEDLAYDLAFECTRPSRSRRHFGFHKMINWPLVMHPADLVKRAQIACESPYLRRTGQINDLLTVSPWLAGPLSRPFHA